MIYRFLLTLLFLTFTCQISVADKLTDEKCKDIKRLMAVTGAVDIATQLGTESSLKMYQQLKETNSKIPDKMFNALKNDKTSFYLEKIEAKGGLKDQLVLVYDKHYTHQEIQELLTFYESPVDGKNTISLKPTMSQEMATIGQNWNHLLLLDIDYRLSHGLNL